MGKMTEAIAS